MKYHSTITYGLQFYKDMSEFFLHYELFPLSICFFFFNVGVLNHIKLKWSVYIFVFLIDDKFLVVRGCVFSAFVSLVPARRIVGLQQRTNLTYKTVGKLN